MFIVGLIYSQKLSNETLEVGKTENLPILVEENINNLSYIFYA
jgi:hypothetical protein